MATRVLIVDDAMFMRAMIKDILLNAGGYEIVGEAQDGEEAIKMHEQFHPELLTMDIVMPNVDGIEATRRIIEKDPSVKIVMCSALGQQQMIIAALEAGAREYIVKPFQPLIVTKAIKKVLV